MWAFRRFFPCVQSLGLAEEMAHHPPLRTSAVATLAPALEANVALVRKYAALCVAAAAKVAAEHVEPRSGLPTREEGQAALETRRKADETLSNIKSLIGEGGNASTSHS